MTHQQYYKLFIKNDRHLYAGSRYINGIVESTLVVDDFIVIRVNLDH